MSLFSRAKKHVKSVLNKPFTDHLSEATFGRVGAGIQKKAANWLSRKSPFARKARKLVRKFKVKHAATEIGAYAIGAGIIKHVSKIPRVAAFGAKFASKARKTHAVAKFAGEAAAHDVGYRVASKGQKTADKFLSRKAGKSGKVRTPKSRASRKSVGGGY